MIWSLFRQGGADRNRNLVMAAEKLAVEIFRSSEGAAGQLSASLRSRSPHEYNAFVIEIVMGTASLCDRLAYRAFPNNRATFIDRLVMVISELIVRTIFKEVDEAGRRSAISVIVEKFNETAQFYMKFDVEITEGGENRGRSLFFEIPKQMIGAANLVLDERSVSEARRVYFSHINEVKIFDKIIEINSYIK